MEKDKDYCLKFVRRHMPFAVRRKNVNKMQFPFASEHAQAQCIESIAEALVKEFHVDKGLRYFKCNRCGLKTVTNGNTLDYTCSNGAPHRKNGICGGSFSVEISLEEFETFKRK